MSDTTLTHNISIGCRETSPRRIAASRRNAFKPSGHLACGEDLEGKSARRPKRLHQPESGAPAEAQSGGSEHDLLKTCELNELATESLVIFSVFLRMGESLRNELLGLKRLIFLCIESIFREKFVRRADHHWRQFAGGESKRTGHRQLGYPYCLDKDSRVVPERTARRQSLCLLVDRPRFREKIRSPRALYCRISHAGPRHRRRATTGACCHLASCPPSQSFDAHGATHSVASVLRVSAVRIWEYLW